MCATTERRPKREPGEGLTSADGGRYLEGFPARLHRKMPGAAPCVGIVQQVLNYGGSPRSNTTVQRLLGAAHSAESENRRNFKQLTKVKQQLFGVMQRLLSELQRLVDVLKRLHVEAQHLVGILQRLADDLQRGTV
jgi:hypothetical protein